MTMAEPKDISAGTPLSLPPQALGRLMPLHLVIGPEGAILSAGPTIRKLCGASPMGRGFFDLFEVRRPRALQSLPALRRRAGDRLAIAARGQTGLAFRGVAFEAGPGGANLLINLSFGIGVIDAVRRHGLTDADFAVTDLAMELLYLVEAKSAVMEELRDLNQRLQGAKRAAETQALTDMLTGLKNRRALDLTLAEVIGQSQGFGLMHVDLDYFKAVNDTLGHAAGDHVLREVARILTDETRKDDLVARVGGDEFVLVFPGLSDTEVLAGIATRLVERLRMPISYGGQHCLISASIGIAVSTGDDDPTPDRVLSEADAALYASKNGGRGRAVFHAGLRGAPAGAPPYLRGN